IRSAIFCLASLRSSDNASVLSFVSTSFAGGKTTVSHLEIIVPGSNLCFELIKTSTEFLGGSSNIFSIALTAAILIVSAFYITASLYSLEYGLRYINDFKPLILSISILYLPAPPQTRLFSEWRSAEELGAGSSFIPG